jgi:hypothetical protein
MVLLQAFLPGRADFSESLPDVRVLPHDILATVDVELAFPDGRF